MNRFVVVAIFLALGASVPIRAATGATEKVLYSFCSQQTCTDGGIPQAGLLDVNGTLYGTTAYGGVGYGAQGTVFSFDPATRTEAVLHTFSDIGTAPISRLLNVKGTLFGTTYGGGRFECPDGYGCGTVFSLDLATGKETELHDFKYPRANWPSAGLTNLNGTLYGTTEGGGAYNCGTLFSINRTNGKIAILHSFGKYGRECFPHGGLLSVNGELYGAVGPALGKLFSFDPATGTEQTIYSFRGHSYGDGSGPTGDLINVNGTLYGTTDQGGTGNCYNGQVGGCGTVFSVDLSTGVETVLHSFKDNRADGVNPRAGLLKVKGRLYGTTSAGGTGACTINAPVGCGTVFSIEPGSGSEIVVYSFQNNGKDGSDPGPGLLNVKGELCGTTFIGGAYGDGTIFTVTP